MRALATARRLFCDKFEWVPSNLDQRITPYRTLPRVVTQAYMRQMRLFPFQRALMRAKRSGGFRIECQVRVRLDQACVGLMAEARYRYTVAREQPNTFPTSAAVMPLSRNSRARAA